MYELNITQTFFINSRLNEVQSLLNVPYVCKYAHTTFSCPTHSYFMDAIKFKYK